MRVIKAFLRSAAYERRFLTKNPWDLSMVLWIPLATVLLVWWIFSQTQISALPIGVIDKDNSPIANTLVRYLDAQPNIRVARLYHSPASAEAAIVQRGIYAVVTIPEDFSSAILSRKPAPIVLQVNAQYGTHSGIIQTSVQSVVGTLSAGVEMQRWVKQGVHPTQAAIATTPIRIQRISLFNAATDYQQFLASTVIPALLHILAMVIGATTIGRELRDKRLDKWYRFIDTGSPDLSLSKNSRADLKLSHHPKNKPKNKSATSHPVHLFVLLSGLMGKYLWQTLAFSLWAALGLWLATYEQDIALSSVLATFLSLVLLMMLSFWLGALLTLGSFSLRMGLSATGFISAPSYAFAGVTYPYIAMNDSAKYWADALPLTHYLKLHIAQLQMHAPTAISLPIVYGLLLATLIAACLSALLSRSALAHPERWGAR